VTAVTAASACGALTRKVLPIAPVRYAAKGSGCSEIGRVEVDFDCMSGLKPIESSGISIIPHERRTHVWSLSKDDDHALTWQNQSTIEANVMKQ
jgi:hypothetical protein